jgi:RNA recognition motif-containing protein
LAIDLLALTESLRNFFGFCGEIESIDYDKSKNEAKIVFKTPAATQTATMLNGFVLFTFLFRRMRCIDERADVCMCCSGSLDGSSIKVTSNVPLEKEKEDGGHTAVPGEELKQEHKPR